MTHADIIALWALGLAVVALIAHIPLTMLAHHYLPKIEDHFASSSRGKLISRIATLQQRLKQMDDPIYFESVEWGLREGLFLVMYFLALGLFALSGPLFVAIGAVPKNWFWDPSSHHLPNFLPEGAVCCFVLCIVVSGMYVFESMTYRPSKRPRLRLSIQAQIDSLQAKLDAFRK